MPQQWQMLVNLRPCLQESANNKQTISNHQEQFTANSTEINLFCFMVCIRYNYAYCSRSVQQFNLKAGDLLIWQTLAMLEVAGVLRWNSLSQTFTQPFLQHFSFSMITWKDISFLRLVLMMMCYIISCFILHEVSRPHTWAGCHVHHARQPEVTSYTFDACKNLHNLTYNKQQKHRLISLLLWISDLHCPLQHRADQENTCNECSYTTEISSKLILVHCNQAHM